MKILVLAPHPFYQDRGTPIAVDLLIQALTGEGHQVDCLCFNEGSDREYPNFRLYRANSLPRVEGIRPGFSGKKLWLDLFFFLKFIGLFLRNRYDVVHAVEESAFMAMLMCKLFRRRFVYDMDSSMATQLVDKSDSLRKVEGTLHWIESLPMRTATAVVPVCDALADTVYRYRQEGVFILKDVSLASPEPVEQPQENLRQSLGIDGPMMMYIGNLESYQGIDLLVESMALALESVPDAHAVIIGGEDAHIAAYRQKCEKLKIDKRVHLIGKRPVAQISAYMSQADLLLSPRVHGVNTPMKVYSYLDSGVAVLATRLPTHTQVMTDEVGFLAGDTPSEFADVMVEALKNPELRQQKAAAARVLIEREHSVTAFRRKLKEVYDYIIRSA